MRPTQRAPDGWESPRFQAVCMAPSWFRQSGVASSRPPAGNAPRWAVIMFKKRFLPILVLLLVISLIAYLGIEKYRIVAVCRDTLAPSGHPFRGDFKYKRIDFLPSSSYGPISVLFDYR